MVKAEVEDKGALVFIRREYRKINLIMKRDQIVKKILAAIGMITRVEILIKVEITKESYLLNQKEVVSTS